jgi:hypothetical protein
MSRQLGGRTALVTGATSGIAVDDGSVGPLAVTHLPSTDLESLIRWLKASRLPEGFIPHRRRAHRTERGGNHQ